MDKWLIAELLNLFDMEKSIFYINDEEMKITSEDMCIILGLPFSGSKVTFEAKSSTIWEKYISKLKGRLSRDLLSKKICSVVYAKEVEDVSKLLIPFLFATVLFSSLNFCPPTRLCVTSHRFIPTLFRKRSG